MHCAVSRICTGKYCHIALLSPAIHGALLGYTAVYCLETMDCTVFTCEPKTVANNAVKNRY